MLNGVFEKLSHTAARRAARLEVRDGAAAERWLRIAAALAPQFSHVHRDTVTARRRAGDRMGAAILAQRFVRRFPAAADAWVLLGDACMGAFRPDQALQAYEHALQLEERPDAAMAAGNLYALRGDHQHAGARYARAFAAGGGPDALKANVKALRAAGDREAAERAIALWKQVTGNEWTEPD